MRFTQLLINREVEGELTITGGDSQYWDTSAVNQLQIQGPIKHHQQFCYPVQCLCRHRWRCAGIAIFPRYTSSKSYSIEITVRCVNAQGSATDQGQSFEMLAKSGGHSTLHNLEETNSGRVAIVRQVAHELHDVLNPFFRRSLVLHASALLWHRQYLLRRRSALLSKGRCVRTRCGQVSRRGLVAVRNCGLHLRQQVLRRATLRVEDLVHMAVGALQGLIACHFHSL
mmetsp:Transcript_13451/g.31630  ORF Transcript_13451/g.31630 Transcript_13451/m.31630 type:complete len:227 (+) Transcript_13451:1213-1893(+)